MVKLCHSIIKNVFFFFLCLLFISNNINYLSILIFRIWMSRKFFFFSTINNYLNWVPRKFYSRLERKAVKKFNFWSRDVGFPDPPRLGELYVADLSSGKWMVTSVIWAWAWKRRTNPPHSFSSSFPDQAGSRGRALSLGLGSVNLSTN